MTFPSNFTPTLARNFPLRSNGVRAEPGELQSTAFRSVFRIVSQSRSPKRPLRPEIRADDCCQASIARVLCVRPILHVPRSVMPPL